MSPMIAPCQDSPPAIDIRCALDEAFWALMFDVGIDEIRQAVQFVGLGLFEVSQYLRAMRDCAPAALH